MDQKPSSDPTWAPDAVVSGRHRLALPGLVNAHTHLGMTALRNYADDLPLETWLFDKIFPTEDRLNETDIYWAAMLGMAEMIASGTTCFADMYMFMDTLAEAVAAVGIRADLARGLQCFEPEFDRQTDARLQEARSLFQTWHGEADGRIQVRFGPHAVYTCVPDYLTAAAEQAAELGAGLHIHLAETAREDAECREKYGLSPTQHLAKLGLLTENTLAAHGVHLTEEDQITLKEHQAVVVHNPGSNLKLGSGAAPIPAMLERGLRLALGTDSAASNNNLDLLEEVYLAAVLHKGVLQDSTAVSAHQALTMATCGGAEALGLPVGRLAPGMKADIILLDTDKPHYKPLYDPVSAVVYAGRGSDVDWVMVDGRVLYEKGEFKTLDLAEIDWHVQRLAERL